jgi:hypothetical protein
MKGGAYYAKASKQSEHSDTVFNSFEPKGKEVLDQQV